MIAPDYSRRRRVRILCYAALLLIVSVCIWSGTTHNLITEGGDALRQHLPSRALAAHMYRAGHFPLWNRFQASGTPLAALIQPGAFYPLNIAIYGALPPAIAFNVSLTLHFLLLALFTYQFLRAIKVDVYGSLLGTVTLTLAGSVTIHTSAVPIFDAMVWIPAIFYCAESWLKTENWKYVAWGGVCVAMPLLAGWAQLLLLGSMYLTVYLLISALSMRVTPRVLAGFLVLFIIGALLTLPQVFLTLQFKQYTNLQSLQWVPFSIGSFAPQLLPLLLLFPCFFGGSPGGIYPLVNWGPPDFPTLTVYAGILPLMLALAAIPQVKTSRVVRFALVLAIVALLMAFGSYTSLGILLYHLPLFKLFHEHWMNLFFFDFAIAILAAHAVDKLDFQELGSTARRIWAIAIPFTVIVLAAFGLIKSRLLVRSMDTRISPLPSNWMQLFGRTVKWHNPAVIIPVVLILLSAVFFWRWTTRPHSHLIAALAIGLVGLDLAFFAITSKPWIYPGRPGPDSRAVIDRMRQEANGKPFRIMAFEPDNPFLLPNANELNDLESIQGYEPFLVLPYATVLDMNAGGSIVTWNRLVVNNSILSLLNVRYIVANRVTMPEFESVAPPDKEAGQPKAHASVNLLDSSRWHGSRSFQHAGGEYTLLSDGKINEGMQYDEVPLQQQSIYEFSFSARADKGVSSDVLGMLVDGHQFFFCELPPGLLTTSFQPHTCLFITHNNSPKLRLNIDTLSSAAVHITDVRLQRVAGLPWNEAAYRTVMRAGDLTLIENRKSLPRAFFVKVVQPVDSNGDARSLIWQMITPIDLQATALVENLSETTIRNLDSGDVEHLDYQDNAVDMRVGCSGNCFLVLADAYLPDWHAYVDGKETSIYRTDATVRGVFISSGSHHVRFVYWPHRFGWSLLAAACGWLAVGCITFWSKGS